MSRINVANFRHPDGTDDNITLDSSGRVGLGTSSPAAKLDVSGNVQFGDGGGFDMNINGTRHQFSIGGTERMRIDSSGRLGIGTTSPATTLDCNGIIRVPQDTFYQSGDGTGGWVELIKADSSNNTYIKNNKNRAIIFETGGAEKARIDSNGRLLVGMSSSSLSTRLQVMGNSASSTGTGSIYVMRGNDAIGSGVNLGEIVFSNYNGQTGAYIQTTSDAAWTLGSSHPARLTFSTTANGASSPTERLRIRANGNTEPGADNTYTIGTSASRWGSVWAANGTIQTSDERTKTQIANAHLGFEFIKSLRPVSYRWIEGGKRETGERNEDGTAIYESVPGKRTHYGFIAQEVKEAVDAAGVDFGGWLLSDKDDPDSQQALRYDQFIAPLTKALQEAITKIETLEGMVAVNNITIDEQQHQLSTLAARLTALESA
jgi:hypothetical protein